MMIEKKIADKAFKMRDELKEQGLTHKEASKVACIYKSNATQSELTYKYKKTLWTDRMVLAVETIMGLMSFWACFFGVLAPKPVMAWACGFLIATLLLAVWHKRLSAILTSYEVRMAEAEAKAKHLREMLEKYLI